MLLASAALLTAPAAVLAAPVESIPAPAPAVVQVAPGISYQRLVDPGGQVVHVLRAQRSGLVSITPRLLTGSPSQRGGLAATLAAESAQGAVAAVNGDFFNLAQAYPSGLTVTAQQGLTNEPEPTRSALVLGGDGSITAGRFTFTGTWQTIDATSLPVGIAHGVAGINRPFERAGDTVLYTSAFGTQTPSGGRTDVLITLDGGGGQLQPNVPLTGTVAQVRSGGGTTIGSGMVLSASGTPGATLAALAPGTRIRITPTIAGFPTGALSLGGGPLLVDAGAAVTDAGEGFTSSQLNPHTARTAIGQAADGSYLLVSADGPDQGSPGITVPQQAQLMQRLGARIAVAMDSGGSAQMLIDGTQMVPWSSPRAVTDGMVHGGHLFHTYFKALGLDHERLTYPNDGRDDSLTDAVVSDARCIDALLA